MSLLALGGCATIGVYRYKVELEFDTPSGPRTGSTILEATYGWHATLETMFAEDLSVRGEAIYVDLGEGKFVVGLLNTGRMLPLPALYDVLGWARPDIQELRAREGKLSGKATLPGGEAPILVTFAGLDNPDTVKLVYEAKINRRLSYSYDYERKIQSVKEVFRGSEVTSDNFEATFGKGYGLRGATLEIVDPKTPFTTTVRDKLGAILSRLGNAGPVVEGVITEPKSVFRLQRTHLVQGL